MDKLQAECNRWKFKAGELAKELEEGTLRDSKLKADVFALRQQVAKGITQDAETSANTGGFL
jgi:hypothetical protein